MIERFFNRSKRKARVQVTVLELFADIAGGIGKHCIFFPPPAAPTYAPLGVAALVAWVRNYAPDCELVLNCII